MRTWYKDAKGLTIIDALISLCLIGALVGVFVPYYLRLERDAREMALKMGLTNIRTSIKLFRMLNERNPESLRALIEKNIMLPSRSGSDASTGAIFLDEKYLEMQAMDAEGHLVDAFGNRYTYNPIRGEVRTSTKGYENW